jgi:hypothetical protein
MSKMKSFRFSEKTQTQLRAIEKIKEMKTKAISEKYGMEIKPAGMTAILANLIEAEYKRLKEEGYEI